ncbi:MAG: hypothetical protein NWS47_03790 [Alphaproteobacteria bacterium]|nr:hypothetical protein [Alphaproteobacteria bacterium]
MEIKVLVYSGTYAPGVNVLQANGTLSTTMKNVSWVSPTQTSYKIETAEDGKSLVLKAIASAEGDENN